MSLPRGRFLRVGVEASVGRRGAPGGRPEAEVSMSIRMAAAELPVLLGMVLVIAAFFLI